MQKNKKIAFLIVIAVVCVAAAVILILKYQKDKVDLPPEQAVQVVNSYLSALQKEDPNLAFSFLFFKDENKNWVEPLKQATKERPLLHYKIEKYQKRNENLYEVFVLYQVANEEPDKQTACNYLMFFQDKWWFVLNKRDVPIEIYDFGEYEDIILMD